MALALVLSDSALKISGAVLLPNVGGFINGYFVTKPNIENGWYGTLRKPAYNPPNWLFGPAWTSIYSAMGYASYLVWLEWKESSISRELCTTALAVYGVQLAVNHSWSPVFFGRHDLKGSFYLIIGLDALAVANAVLFYRVSTVAGWLLAPYLAWLGYASYLNYSIWQRNPQNNETTQTAEDVANGEEDDDDSPLHDVKKGL